jgi:uncharacterized protein GlcG (DUF336 family)
MRPATSQVPRRSGCVARRPTPGCDPDQRVAGDGTPFLAAEVAVDKAWTAASFRLATHTWNSLVADPHVAPLAQHPRLMAVGGGFPLFDDGVCVGGLGISGGTAQQDENAAHKALKAQGFPIPD